MRTRVGFTDDVIERINTDFPLTGEIDLHLSASLLFNVPNQTANEADHRLPKSSQLFFLSYWRSGGGMSITIPSFQCHLKISEVKANISGLSKLH